MINDTMNNNKVVASDILPQYRFSKPFPFERPFCTECTVEREEREKLETFQLRGPREKDGVKADGRRKERAEKMLKPP